MGIRTALANSVMTSARAIGNMLGCELAVVFSQHSIKLKMTTPGGGEFAWDPDLYVQGNAFYEGYANPLKIQIDENTSIKEPDEAEVLESDGGARVEDGRHVSVISSKRYRLAAQNNIISQLINPKERLKLIQWALIGIGGLLALDFLISLVTAGSVGVF